MMFSDKNHGPERKAASKRAGSETTITLRDCRHTYATIGLQHTSDPTATMRALGHKDLRTTELYQSSTVDRTAAVGAGPAEMIEEASKG